MLTERRAAILWSLIEEYISTATPVPSQTIAWNYGLGVSPATIRNEMVQLEEDGYIYQPHTSAGRVPSPKGYRYYVEVLLREKNLSPDEQRTIRHQFHQATKDTDDLIRLSATILSRMLNNVAIVTTPRLSEPRLRLLDLVSLKEFSVLVLLVFQNASFRQQVISTTQDSSQEDLNATGRKLTDLYVGLTGSEIESRDDQLSAFEQQVAGVVLEMMEAERKSAVNAPYLEGVAQLLSQPEFSSGERARLLMELLEKRDILNAMLSQAPDNAELRVIIGSENPESALQDLSVVLSRYGLRERSSGIVGVVGPMRMQYGKAFSTVRFLSGTMSEMLDEMYG